MTTSRSIKAAAVGLGLVVAMGLTACTSDGVSASASAGCDNEKVRIASAGASFVYLPYYVAEAAGYLEDEGLDVETMDLSAGSGIIAGAVSNTVDIALSTFAEVAVAKGEGAPVSAFAQVTKMATNVVIKKSVLADKGLTAGSDPEDKVAALRGLRIGVTGAGSGSDLVVRYLARVGGMDPDKDMTITASGSSSNSVAGFASDRFDAIAISSPQSDVGIERGDGTYLFNIAAGEYEPLSEHVYIVALASDRTLKSKANVVQCFTEALARAQKDIQEDPEAAAELVRDYMGDEIDQATYDRAFEGNLASWADTPVIDEGGARAALDFQNTVAGTDLDDEVLAEAVNTEIATAVGK